MTADLGDRETDWPHAGWWWLGVHGGAGVSSLDAVVPGGGDANRRWPDPARGGPRAVVLVARASGHGLRCLRGVLRQHADGRAPVGLHLVGVAVVADRPGRTPRHLAQQVGMLTGIAPVVWRVPWITDLLECPDPVELPLPPVLGGLDSDLGCLRPATPPRAPDATSVPCAAAARPPCPVPPRREHS